MDMCPQDTRREIVLDSMDLSLSKQIDRGAVVIRLQDGTETVVYLDRLTVFKGESQVEWSKQLIFAEKEGRYSSKI